MFLDFHITPDLFIWFVILQIVLSISTTFIVVDSFFIWRKDHSPFAFALFVIMITSGVQLIYSIYIQVNFIVYHTDVSFFIGLLSLDLLFTILIGGGYLSFLFYIANWKKAYTFPGITTLFFMLYVYKTGDVLPGEIFVLISCMIAAIALFYNSIKNRNGLSFAIVGSIFLFILADVIGSQYFSYFVLRMIASIVLLLGTTGWWDRHVFYDREYRKQIQSRWIASFVTNKSKK